MLIYTAAFTHTVSPFCDGCNMPHKSSGARRTSPCVCHSRAPYAMWRGLYTADTVDV